MCVYVHEHAYVCVSHLPQGKVWLKSIEHAGLVTSAY